jgi:guanine deaminase
MSAKFAVLGHTVDAPSLGEVRGLEGTPALVVVSATGVIEQVTRTGAVEAADKLEAQGIDVKRLGPREYLVPGFVDCHIHTSQWAYMGTGIDKPLMADDGFLAKYAFPAESSLNDETARAVYGAALDDMLRNGTTTGLIFGSARADASRHLVSLAIERRGPRSLVGKVGMDRYCPEGYVETTAQSLADMEEFIVHTKAANAQAQGEAAAGAFPLSTTSSSSSTSSTSSSTSTSSTSAAPHQARRRW